MTDPVPPATPPPGWGDVAVVLAVVLLPAVHGGFADILWPAVVPRHPPAGYFYTSLLATLAGWVALVLYLIARSGRPAADFGLTRPRWADPLLAAALVGGFWWVGGRVGGLFEYDASAFPPPPRGWGVALVVAGYAAVGFTEELVWRGYLLTRLEDLTGSTWQAVAFTSLLFGLAHLYQGVGGPVNAAAIGLMCAGVFVVTRRLAPVALAHAVYDIHLATWDC